MQRRKLINVDALSGVRDFLVSDGGDEDGDLIPRSPPSGSKSSQVRPVTNADASREELASSSSAIVTQPSPVDFGCIDAMALDEDGNSEIPHPPPLPDGWMRCYSKSATLNGEAYTLNFGTRVSEASARNSQVTWARVGDESTAGEDDEKVKMVRERPLLTK